MSDSKKGLDTLHDYLGSKIFKAKKTQIHDSHTNEEYTRLKREIVVQSILRSRSNLKDYARFMELVKDKQYFHIDDINSLNLPYDICIFLSKKGIGKSYWMIQYINEIVDDGGAVVVIRTTDEDRKCGFAQHIFSYDAHFTMDSKGNLYHKDLTEIKIVKKIDQKTGDIVEKETLIPKWCGVAMSLTTALKWKGGGYENVRAIIYDEASDQREGVTTAHYTNFIVSMANSIERQKRIPIIILGNTDFSSAHPLFESFQIDPDENLVYIDRQPEGAKVSSKILYINSRGLYNSGAEFSHFIGSVGDVHRAMAAFKNEACVVSHKVLALDMTVLGEPVVCLAFVHQKEVYYVKLAKYAHNINRKGDKENWYFMQVEPFNPVYTHGYRVFCADRVTASLFNHVMTWVPDLENWWKYIEFLLWMNKVFFIGWDSTELIRDQINKALKKEKKGF